MVAFPAVVEGEPITISATTYLAYLQCEMQGVARLEGVYGAESRSGLRGGLAHRIFARHLERGEIDPAGFAQACREEIGAALNPKLGALGIKPSELAAVIKEVGDLYARFKTFPVEGFRAAEVFLEVEPVPGVTLRGSVDAVFDDDHLGARLIDWKTGDLGEAAPQLGFYALAWTIDCGEPPGLVEAVSVTTGERFSESPSEPSLVGTAARVAALVDVARRRFAGVGDPERVGGPWCRWCPLLSGCREGSAAVAVTGCA